MRDSRIALGGDRLMGIALIAGAQLMRTNIPIGQVGGALGVDHHRPPTREKPKEMR